jgi:hypothetical protein
MQIHVITLNVDGEQVGAWATVHPEKAAVLVEKLEDAYGTDDDTFVGVYLAAIELETHIDEGPVNALGTPLIARHEQQSLF